ncbi:hypothetical protein BJY04DRAFT_222673 [Aspergillus karnatakaensis]|uniref:uncharacterized protein n=1 Tax=Aspergillus karnatakaensis TaxID=1810916 RepID=UPI003CCCEB5B
MRNYSGGHRRPRDVDCWWCFTDECLARYWRPRRALSRPESISRAGCWSREWRWFSSGRAGRRARRPANDDEVKNMIEGMQAGLETLKESWKDGMHALESVVDEIQKKVAAVFHINKIEVGIHTHALIKDEPLMFTFIGTVGGKDFDIKADWLPAKTLKDLYKDVTNEILKIA